MVARPWGLEGFDVGGCDVFVRVRCLFGLYLLGLSLAIWAFRPSGCLGCVPFVLTVLSRLLGL